MEGGGEGDSQAGREREGMDDEGKLITIEAGEKKRGDEEGKRRGKSRRNRGWWRW